MKKWLSVAVGLVVIMAASSVIRRWSLVNNIIVSPVGVYKEKPLEKYTIENLQRRGGISSKITYSDNKFYFYSDGRKISGIVNGATDSGRPVVVMFHGSADEGEYYPGFGTQKVAEALAKNGFTTYAPDFLGYGESDPGTENDFENRFLTWTTNMDLITSIHYQLPARPAGGPTNNLYLWGHSNGGQIALSILTITGWQYPTVLWNPVTKPFPYNILYFIDGYDDEGRWLRKVTAEFEKEYDVDKYSFDKYLSNIKAPILLQQGEADEWVPVKWNRSFNSKFATLNSQFQYKEYPGANHNLAPKWQEAVNDLLKYYRAHN
jgi:alpha-beta hydrolase superfamily lysophospholipase